MMVHIHFSWMNLDRTFIGKFSYRISVVEYYMFYFITGQTCLHLAAEHSHLPIIRLLVLSGANLNIQVRNKI